MSISITEIGAVIAKCSGFRPDKTPQPSELVLRAWHEHFTDWPHVTVEDALEAVKVYHREPHERMIQPADISRVAREIRRDKSERETESERRAREELLDGKAEGRREAVERFALGFRHA